ncbi:hypothetical protein SAMN05444161_6738 [Rhizobiales bacterium GAS191]|nr:hypothetical protein SAMN05444161_6738 [Rhizobiales bacterium GAS191]
MRPADKPDNPDIPMARVPPCPSGSSGFGNASRFIGETVRTFGLPLFWPYASFEAAVELALNSCASVYRGQDVRYGDGKPIVLVPGHLGGDVTLAPLSLWLHAIGYRPAKSNILININDQSLDEPMSAALRGAARRVGRKAVMIAFDTGLRAALRVAAIEQEHVSDLIAFGLPDRLPPLPAGIRLHVIESSRRVPVVPDQDVHLVEGSRALLPVNPAALRILSEILRGIPITLLDEMGGA